MAVSAREPTPISMEEAVGYDRIGDAPESPEDRLVLKHDRYFLLADGQGCLPPGGRSALGLFRDDTRILSCYELRFGGEAPALLSTQLVERYLAQIDLAVSDRAFGGTAWDPKNVIHIRREILLDDRLIERVTLTSYLHVAVDYDVELVVGADFADIFEVRGWKREQRGQFYTPEVRPRSITFRYRDRAGELLESTLCFADPPAETHAGGARWRLRLEPREPRAIEWQLVAGGVAAALPRAHDLLARRIGPLRDGYARWRAACTRWETDVEEFDLTLHHAVDDLFALYTGTDGDAVITAGIPWYSTVFGRDSIIASLETLPLNPRIAVDTLRYLARHQGVKTDPYTEEQPGRILHELRRGEMARTGEIPHTPYFGSIDATPLWLVLFHETWRWTGDEALVRELLPHAARALEWIDRFGDVDGDGFVEYASTSERGLVNQGWKDSSDGVPFPDGTQPRPPIALVEVQGYVYDARLRMAQLFLAMGDEDTARRLREEAAVMRRRIVDRFWLPELGTFALALDGDKRPIPTIASNAGHLLWSRVPTRDLAIAVADRLLADDMFSGWGIRTLSSSHTVYNPMSYHAGSVWPHDNAIIALGLAHYGLGRYVVPVVQALHEVAIHMKLHRLPELFCGMRRSPGMHPVLYPVSCSPQAWASGAMFLLLQAALGIFPDAPAGVLHIREPHLPPFLNRLTVQGLRVGDARVALEFRRYEERTLANLLSIEGGPLRVQVDLY